MTNGSKFVTVHERIEAFRKYCEKMHDRPGGSCGKQERCSSCSLKWLDLECEEEEPLPCPFCGGDGIKFSIIEDASDQYMACPMVFCNRCGANFELDWHRASDLGTNVTDEQKRQLLAKWNNRVSKAVRESEGK